MKTETKTLTPATSNDICRLLESTLEHDTFYKIDELSRIIKDNGFNPDRNNDTNYMLHRGISQMRKIGQLSKDSNGYFLTPGWHPKIVNIKSAEKVVVEPLNPDWSEINEFITKRFRILDRRISGCIEGTRNSIIVTGAPGMGKSYGIWEQMVKKVPEERRCRIKGRCTPIQLYMKMYEYQHKGCLILVDDCDSILADEDGLNLIKAATEQEDLRQVNWQVTSPMLQKMEIPQSFIFSGSIVFISNKDYKESNKQTEHIAAVINRTGTVDVNCWRKCDKLVRIQQIAEVSKFDDFKKNKISAKDQKRIMQYLAENYIKFHYKDLSLRLPNELARIFAECGKDWNDFTDDVETTKFESSI